VRFFEIWSPLGDVDEIVDISDVIDEKRRAIRAYRSQCAVMRLDDAFVGLARYRGEMHSWPGGPYAEVFAAG
jgi:LmbE family N-acetylglucosaminyl deacetylase